MIQALQQESEFSRSCRPRSISRQVCALQKLEHTGFSKITAVSPLIVGNGVLLKACESDLPQIICDF